jgi:hypothetical protein
MSTDSNKKAFALAVKAFLDPAKLDPDLRKGFARLQDRETSFLPSSGEFKSACRNARERVEWLHHNVRNLLAAPMPALSQIEARRTRPAQIEYKRPVQTAVGLEVRDTLRERSSVPGSHQEESGAPWPFDDDDGVVTLNHKRVRT